MSLAELYKRFLASPNASALADDVTLSYVSTLVTVNDAPAVIKHYNAQAKQISKKAEKFIAVVEGSDAVSIDVETTMEFQIGGGAYLPGLDDNFLTDKTVVLPSIHIVHFDEQKKIRQIRLYWDQGSLLKSVEVIGARARNWPLRDGKDQIRLISSCASAVTGGTGPSVAAPESRRTTVSRDSDHRPLKSRSHAGSTTSATYDPHATLQLFAPATVDENEASTSQPGVTPRASARPPTRDLDDLIGNNDDSPEPSTPGGRSSSPHKRMGIAPKGGAGKNFRPIRLFDEEELPEEKGKRTDSKKYKHFEFGEGEDAPIPSDKLRKHSTKHNSQWNFEDFATPQPLKPKVRPNDQRHFGWSDDEEQSPVRRQVVHRPRPDAEKHFEFVDDGTPMAERRVIGAGQKGRTHNNRQGLYKDHILNADGDDSPVKEGAGKKGPLASITTNPNTSARSKDFGAQWEMTDESPEAARGDENSGNQAKKISEDKKKVLKGLSASWEMYDQSPEPTRKIYRTEGDGMGGRRAGGRGWAIGDESEEEAEKIKAPKGRATAEAAPEPARKIYKTDGDGMGGRKNGRGWSIGDESEEEVEKPQAPKGRATAGGAQGGKDFWDF